MTAGGKLALAPLVLRKANAFVQEHHRHCKPVRGCRFCLGAIDSSGRLVGVVIVGRPKARAIDDGFTAEVNRLCVAPEAQKGACSFLYGRAWRVWQAMGGRRMLTYTLATESGASLRGAGWRMLGLRGGRKSGRAWHGPEREREQEEVYELDKIAWEAPA